MMNSYKNKWKTNVCFRKSRHKYIRYYRSFAYLMKKKNFKSSLNYIVRNMRMKYT